MQRLVSHAWSTPAVDKKEKLLKMEFAVEGMQMPFSVCPVLYFTEKPKQLGVSYWRRLIHFSGF